MGTLKTYRLQKIKHNPTTLSGLGASKLGGRWNKEGVPLIYTSLSTSLTILEMKVHLGITKLPPLNIVTMELPEECIHEFAVSDLPKGWDSVPVQECSQLFLIPYLESCHKLAYSVPSAVNRLERNLLINPDHPDIRRVVIKQFDPFNLDVRLFNAMMD